MSITRIPSAGLEDTGVTAGTRGSSSEIPIVTVNSKGQVTQIGGAALDLSWTGISGRPTALSAFSNDRQYFVNVSNAGSGDGAGSGSGFRLGKSGETVVLSFNSNCNCNCCCCFAPGTLVKMADGSVKPIEEVMVGEQIESMVGSVTVAHKFDTTLKNNSLWKLNGELVVTGGHLFSTTTGWAALDLSVYPDQIFYRSAQEFVNQELSDVIHQHEQAESVRQLVVGDVVNGIEIKSIERLDATPETNVHNLIVHGADHFIVDKGYVVDGFMRHVCGGQQ